MDIADPFLPAAPYLTGPGAPAVIHPVVAASGGELVDLAAQQVMYRPERDLIVSYLAQVRWGDGPVQTETILAGTTVDGPPPGTLVVEADDLAVGVWRYPFDPELPGLATGTTPSVLGPLLAVDPTLLRLDVRAFRPAKRAVVQARWPGGEAFVKVLRPSKVADVVTRHRALLDAGIPVPEIIAVDPDLGVIAMRALPGEDVRARLLRGEGPVPGGDTLVGLVDAFAAVDLPSSLAPRRTLLSAAPHHGALVAQVLPSAADQVERILAVLDEHRRTAPDPVLVPVHGDLHEAQIRIDEAGHVVGILDVDDVGPGDPLDDLGRSLAHLIALSVVHHDVPSLADHADRVAADLARRVDPTELGMRTAAALVGLATGPFRSQAREWTATTVRLLDLAEAWVTGSSADERTLSTASSSSHPTTR